MSLFRLRLFPATAGQLRKRFLSCDLRRRPDSLGNLRSYEHPFAPTSVRYVRALSYKPNDAGQEGGQMCVAELEVYEK